MDAAVAINAITIGTAIFGDVEILPSVLLVGEAQSPINALGHRSQPLRLAESGIFGRERETIPMDASIRDIDRRTRR